MGKGRGGTGRDASFMSCAGSNEGSPWDHGITKPLASNEVQGRFQYSRLPWRLEDRRSSHHLASTSCSYIRSQKRSAIVHGSALRGGAGTVMLSVPREGDDSTDRMAQALNYCKYLLSGAMSAVVSRSTVAPFERIKMDMLLSKGQGTAFATAVHIVQSEGVLALWKGNILNLMRTAPHKAMNFTAYDVYSNLLQKLADKQSSAENKDRMKNVARFTAGAMAGVTATAVCFPLDVLRVRLLARGGSPYGGLVATAQGILKHEGISKFYTGILPAIISMGPAGAVFYGAYDFMKDWALQDEARAMGLDSVDGLELGPQKTLLFGGLAGAMAEASVYPLEVIRRRMQVFSSRAARNKAAGAMSAGDLATMMSNPLAPMASSATKVFRQEGIKGFYSGAIPSIIQVLPNAAISYLAYETFKKILRARPLSEEPKNVADRPDGNADGAARRPAQTAQQKRLEP